MIFLKAKCGDYVAVFSEQESSSDWWIGRIISRSGSSIDQNTNTLFQVVDVDTGVIKIINADCVVGII